MNKELKKQLKKSYIPPPPIRKEVFLETLSLQYSERLSKVIITQIKYTRPIYWIVTFIFLALVIFISQYNSLEKSSFLLISSILPVFSLAGLSEICKSISYNMRELELSCKYNLSFIILIRLTIISISSFILLLVCLFFVKDIGFGIFRNILYLFLPFVSINFISLHLINLMKTKDIMYIISGISFIHFIVINIFTGIYSVDYVGFWSISLIIMTFLLFKEIYEFVKRMEELSWNFA